MQFGLILPSYLPAATPEVIKEAALQAEQAGFDSVWTTDHVIVPADSPAPYHYVFEALTTLSWLAGVTQRIKLGVSVLVLPQRNPILVAKEVATLDALSGGRTMLGVGVGWEDREFAYLNANFDERGEIQDESIRVLRHLWSGETEPFEGQHFRFSGHAFGPLPAQPGGPPIWIGGASPSARRRAARLGDGWHAIGQPPEELKSAIDEVRRHSSGRTMTMSLRIVVGDRRETRHTPRGVQTVFGGTAGDLMEDLRRYQDAGCEYVAVSFWDGDRAASLARQQRFANEVLGRL
ncbi:MAG: LLM class F420-dependent oxidoreductase [Chloroflexi bacterium]|nr:LLM class F420-dependent oxidoreductase [Chloroflexota bacterium]